MTKLTAVTSCSNEQIKTDNLEKLSVDHYDAKDHLNSAIDQYDSQDHFITKDGVRFAGYHLIIDFWGAEKLDDLNVMETALRQAVKTAHATLLHIHLHHFSPNGGISGVAVLAESHISVHTWPEFGFAAFDVFMCGDAMPHKTIEILRDAFSPNEIKVNEFKRGRVGA